MMKICILGHCRHGKDTLAEILNERFGMTYISSSEAANRYFIYESLKDKYGYKSEEECFDDRVNHRDEWYSMICKYNQNDSARLSKNILENADCYVGMRDYDEFIGSKNLFDYIIWVDASERLPKENGTFNIPKNEADIIIENNTTLEDFTKKSIKLGFLLFSNK
jgi:dephospho-CoA kinase